MSDAASYRITIAVLLLGFSSSGLLVYAKEVNFSSDQPVIGTVASSVTTAGARSDIECAVKCNSGSIGCQSYAFAPATNSCFMAAASNADFSTAAPGASGVFRKLTNADWFRDAFAQIGSRRFRIIQQRVKGSLSFAGTWSDYENGFGDDTDFWLGLKTINTLTGSTPRLLRVETLTWAGVLYVCEYSGFTVNSASTRYQMTFATYVTANSNTSSDAFNYHKDGTFSTSDNNNGNTCSANNCGGGGWWYKSCSYTNPSGLYYTSAVSNGERTMNWYGAGSSRLALKTIRLMLLE